MILQASTLLKERLERDVQLPDRCPPGRFPHETIENECARKRLKK
jgi:hypothetical protein